MPFSNILGWLRAWKAGKLHSSAFGIYLERINNIPILPIMQASMMTSVVMDGSMMVTPMFTMADAIFSSYLTLVLRRGGVATTHQTVFVLVLRNAQPRGKIAPGTFNFILYPDFSKKKIDPTTSPTGRVSFQS